MPQVFKSRRNILRAANKSKREHFTQGSPTQKGVFIKDLEFKLKIKTLTQRKQIKTGYGGYQGQKTVTPKDEVIEFNVNSGTDIIASKESGDTVIASKESGESGKYGTTKVSLNELGNKITLEHVWSDGTLEQDPLELYITGEKDGDVYTRYDLDVSQDPPKPWTKVDKLLKWTLDVPASPEEKTDFQFFILRNDSPRERDSPKLIFNTAGTFYVEYFAASGLPITWQDTKGKKINAEVGDMENLPATTKKVKISRQNDFIRSESLILENPDTVDSLPSSGAGPDAPVPDATVPDATVPIKTFQDQWGSVVGNEGIKTCKQLNNAREQIFGLGSVNCESFQQAPKEFPNSKKKKDEDFTQDFQVLMSQLESKIDTLIAATGPQGSYVTKRNEQLGSLESIIGSEIEGDTAFIGSMSDSLKATGSMISARIVQLKDLKSDFDRISGSEVWENISKKYID